MSYTGETEGVTGAKTLQLLDQVRAKAESRSVADTSVACPRNGIRAANGGGRRNHWMVAPQCRIGLVFSSRCCAAHGCLGGALRTAGRPIHLPARRPNPTPRTPCSAGRAFFSAYEAVRPDRRALVPMRRDICSDRRALFLTVRAPEPGTPSFLPDWPGSSPGASDYLPGPPNSFPDRPSFLLNRRAHRRTASAGNQDSSECQ